jgi:hypothetical protein
MQKRLDLSVRKTFQVSERLSIRYEFNVFNVFNQTSMDVPQDQAQIRQNFACSNSALAYVPTKGLPNKGNNCAAQYVNYGQIATSPTSADQQSALANLDQLPYSTGTGTSLSLPTEIPLNTQNANGANLCTADNTVNAAGCPNNAANFGSVTGTIGGNRAVTMALHVVF